MKFPIIFYFNIRDPLNPGDPELLLYLLNDASKKIKTLRSDKKN